MEKKLVNKEEQVLEIKSSETYADNKIIGVVHSKTLITYTKAISVIEKKILNGERITFYIIAKEAKVSASFLYGNEKIRKQIEKYRNISK